MLFAIVQDSFFLTVGRHLLLAIYDRLYAAELDTMRHECIDRLIVFPGQFATHLKTSGRSFFKVRSYVVKNTHGLIAGFSLMVCWTNQAHGATPIYIALVLQYF